MNEKTKAKALKTLDGLEEIVRNERLIQGEYIDQDVDPEFSGAICQGHKACLLGSAWLAYGVKPVNDREGWVALPGVSGHERQDFFRNRPALKAVYVALNAAAQRKVLRNPELRQAFYDSREQGGRQEFLADYPVDGHISLAETLFEDGDLQKRGDMLRFIRSARREIEAA